MKKILLTFIFIFSFFLGLSHSYANWYGGVWVSKGIGNGATWCPTDGNTAGGSPTFSGLGTYTYDSRVTSESGSFMYCEYWDAAAPTLSLSDYNSAWRAPFTLTLYVSDTGGSGVAEAKYSWNSTPNCFGGAGTSFSNGTNIPVGPPYATNTLYLCVRDAAGNTNTLSQTYRIDNVPPVITATPNSMSRTNVNIPVTLSCTDPQWTSCTDFRYIWSTSPTPPALATYTSVPGINPSVNTTLTTEGVWYLHTYGRDVSMPSHNYTTFGPYMLDKTPPVAADITSSTLGYSRATNALPISITGDAAGLAPIVLIQGRFENVNNESTLNPIRSSNSDNVPLTLNILETTEDVSLVDNYRTINNYRDYVYNITNVCDQAGNCTANITSFNYYIYAGYINSTNSSVTGISNLTGQIADGTNKALNITLRDDYNNRIVPVYESNGTTIRRNLNFNLNYDNDLFLNQYNKTGDSGVDVSGFDNLIYTPSSIGVGQNNNTLINDRLNNDGLYNLIFRVYSPTYNPLASDGRQWADGNFTLNSLSVQLLDKGTPDTLYSTLTPFDFRPQYTTQITGSIIDNNKFIVGTTQTGSINVTSAGVKEVYIEFGYYDSTLTPAHRSHPRLNLEYKKSSLAPWEISAEGYTIPYSSLSPFSDSSSNLFTKLVQDGPLTIAEQNTYLATHIKTNILGKDVVYSSDIFGMDRYAGANTGDNTSQRGVKITGITHSQKQIDIVDGQSASDISLLGNLEKAYLQRDVRKNSYSLIKGITPTNGSRNITNVNQSSPGYRLGDVLYFGNLNGENVNINLSGNYSGVKTILVQGGNVYIRSNILAANKTTDILGIIALKNDSTGNGGNIYIDPSVLEVNAVLYADRALVSYNGLNEISPDNGGSYEALNRQLYIYGTVFSNNTIGGSVQTPYLCPFYISNCTLDNSQKFDMNYLRRGYDTKRVASYEDYPVIINYNSLIQLTPPPLFEKK